MIKSVDEKPALPRVELDLTGPDGNAYALMGYACNFAARQGKDTKAILAEMKSSDYENLVQVMEREFGDLIVMYR